MRMIGMPQQWCPPPDGEKQDPPEEIEVLVTFDAPRQVLEWRCESLARAGYGLDAIQLIAPRLDIDLHEAVSLLESGCSSSRALAILL